MSGWVAVGLMWVGAAFMLLAAVGIVRLPDTFTRLQAATKAVTLGVSSMMLATAFHFSDMGVTVRALTTILFLFVTAPVAAHLIGRGAYLVGAEMWDRTQFDELREALLEGDEEPAPPDRQDEAARQATGPFGQARRR